MIEISLVAKRLKELRTERGLSHQALIEALSDKYGEDGFSISKDSLINYEKTSGKIHCVRMSAETLWYLADFYGVSTDWLLGKSDFKSSKMERLSAGGLCLSEKTVGAMFGERSVSPALNLLFETETFREFLSTLRRYHHACEADHIADRIIEDLMIEQNTVNPDNKEISKKLLERSNNGALDSETQDFLMCLSDRYEKATGGAIYSPDEVENVFGDGLRLSDIYEYQAQRLFFSLLDDLQKKTRMAF